MPDLNPRPFAVFGGIMVGWWRVSPTGGQVGGRFAGPVARAPAVIRLCGTRSYSGRSRSPCKDLEFRGLEPELDNVGWRLLFCYTVGPRYQPPTFCGSGYDAPATGVKEDRGSQVHGRLRP